MTSLARNALRILGAAGLGIPAALDRLNQLILDERAPGTFLTLVHGEIVPGDQARWTAGLPGPSCSPARGSRCRWRCGPRDGPGRPRPRSRCSA